MGMKEKNVKIKVDKYEYNLILDALDKYRKQKAKEDGNLEKVNELLLKIID